jgi:integrase
MDRIEKVLDVGKLQSPASVILRLQLLTGCRPGELVQLRGWEINQNGIDNFGIKHAGVWLFSPGSHKNTWRGDTYVRLIPLGPRAQKLLKPHLRDDYIFKSQPKSGKFCEHFTVSGYAQAVRRACVRAGVSHFSPHQVRHQVATEMRSRFGILAAQGVLGHSNPDVTAARYAEAVAEVAKIARKLG